MNAPDRPFPTALIAGYVAGLGLGFGSIPLGVWLCDSSRDAMGMGFLLVCATGIFNGILATLTLSIVSLIRRERARPLAIINIAVLGLLLAAVATSIVVQLL
jgi:hypothetical protein